MTTGVVIGLTAFLMGEEPVAAERSGDENDLAHRDICFALRPIHAGTLSMHWLADHLLLWQSPITHESLLSAHAYYSNTVLGMDTPFAYALHAGWVLAAGVLIGKILGGRRESNWLFDGASLCE